MSNTIDQRTVEMVFDNAQFEKGVDSTIKSLEALDKSLGLANTDRLSSDLKDLSSGATGIDEVAEKIESGKSKIIQAFESLAEGFGKITIVTAAATAAFGAITSAFNFQGGWNRALNIENAKFQLKGLGIAWKDVSDDINYAVQDTAYGLDSAAKAAAQLAASNVNLGHDMKQALRGISGVAAMTNSSYDEIAHTFTRVAGNGRVMAVDLRSLAARGLNAAAVLAEKLGITEQEVYDIVSKGEIDFKTFAEAMDDAFGEHSKKANETFTGALSNMNAAWSRFWAAFLTPEGGNVLDMLRRIFLAVKQYVSGLINVFEPLTHTVHKWTDQIASFVEKFFKSFGNILFEFDKDGKFKNLTSIGEKIGNVFTSLYDVVDSFLTPIAKALKATLPSFKELYDFLDTLPFDKFFERLKLTTGESKFLQAGLTAVFNILVKIGEFIGNTLMNVFNGLATILTIGRDAIGYFADKLDWFVKRGLKFFNNQISGVNDTLEDFFGFINNSYLFNNPLANLIKDLATLFKDLFGIMQEEVANGYSVENFEKFANAFISKIDEIRDRITAFIEEIGIVMPDLSGIFSELGNLLSGIWNLFTKPGGGKIFFEFIGGALSELGSGLIGVAKIAFDAVDMLANAVGDFLGWAFPVITSVASGIGDILLAIGTGLTQVLGSFLGGFGIGIIKGNEEISDSFVNTGNSASDYVDKINSLDTNKHPLLKFTDGLFDAFGRLHDVIENRPPEVADWMVFFNQVTASFSELVTWLDPIGRISNALKTLKEAFKDFGTEDFEGWGDKFSSPTNSWYEFLNTVSKSLSDGWKAFTDALPKPDQIQEAFGNIGKGIGDFFSSIAPFIEGAGRLLGAGLKKIIEAIAGFFKGTETAAENATPVFDLIHKLADKFNEFTKTLVGENTEEAAGKIDKVAGTIDHVSSAFSKINDDLAGLSSFSKNLDESSSISGPIKIVADAISSIIPIGAESKLAGKVLGTSGETLNDSGNEFADVLKFLGDLFEAVAPHLMSIIQLYFTVKMFAAFTKMAKSIASFATTLNNATGKLAKVANVKTTKPTILNKITELMKWMSTLILSVAVLSAIDPERLWPAVAAVGALALIIVGVVAASTVIENSLGKLEGAADKTVGVSIQLAGLGIALVGAALAMKVISEIPSDAILPAVGVVAALCVGFVAISNYLSKVNGKIITSSIGLSMLGGVMLEFAIIIGIFTLIPWEYMKRGIIAFIAILGILMTSCMVLSTYSKGLIKASIALSIIGGVIGSIASALIFLNQWGGDNVIANAIVLGILFAELTASILLINKFATETKKIGSAVNAITQLSFVLSVIGFAVSMLAEFNPINVAASTASLVASISALTIIYVAISNFSKNSGSFSSGSFVGAILGLAGAMNLIASAIKTIADLDIANIAVAAAALSGIIVIMGVVLGVMQGLTSLNPVSIVAVSASMVILSLSLIAIANALKTMSGVSWESVGQLVVTLLAITALSAVIGILAPLAIGLEVLGTASLMVGGAVLAASVGFAAFVGAIGLLADKLPAFADAIDSFLSKMIDTMHDKFPKAIDVFIENLQTLADKAPEIMESVTQIIVSIITGLCDSIVELVPTVADSLVRMMESAVEWMSSNSGRLENAVTGFAGVLGQMLGTAILAIPQMLASFIQTVVTGIGDMLHDNAQNMANNAVDDYVNAYSDAVNNMSAKEIAAALAKMNPGDLKIQGSVSIAGVETSWDGASDAAQRYAAILDRIYKDPALKAQVDECEEVKGRVDEITGSYQDMMGTGPRWVENTAAVTDATNELNESVNELHVEYGNLGFDFNSIFEGLKGNEVFSKLNFDGEKFSELLNNLGGEGGTVQGLMTALGDATALEKGLVEIIGEEGVAALTNQGISIEMIQGALANATSDADQFGVTLTEGGEEAYYTLQDISTALANGIDVSAALKSMESLRQSIYDLRTAFNSVNVVATAAFNLMSVKVGAKIAETKAKIGTLPTYAKTMMTRLSSNVATGASGIGTAMFSVGKYMVAGFVSGITYYRYMATNAGKALARAAKDAAKKELDVESPSKVFFEIGKFVAIGFGNGIYRYSNYASDIAGDMGSQATKSMRSSLADISEMVNGIDWDAQPTIRPVLDTSNVEAGWAYINGLIGRSPTMQAAYAGPRNGRVISSNSSRVTNVSIDLHYQAGTDGAYMANDIANALAMKLNLEA